MAASDIVPVCHAASLPAGQRIRAAAAWPDLQPSMLLLRRAQAGDRDALNDLIVRYYDRVFRIVRIRMGKRLRRTMESWTNPPRRRSAWPP